MKIEEAESGRGFEAVRLEMRVLWCVALLIAQLVEEGHREEVSAMEERVDVLQKQFDLMKFAMQRHH